jgi:chitodextrinase
MKKIFFMAIIIFGLLAFADATFAADWYVDNTISISGNGQSWGTAWKNFSNIVWGASGVKTGDTLYISGGSASKTYFETLTVSASGISENARVKIDVGANSPSPSGHNGVVIIDGEGSRTSGILVSGQNYVTVNGMSGSVFKLLVQNCISGNGAVRVTGGSYVNIDYVKVNMANSRGIRFETAAYSRIRGCDIRTGDVVSTEQTDGIYFQFGHDNIVEYNTIVLGNGTLNASEVTEGHNDCMQVANGEARAIIRNNWLEHADGRGNEHSQVMMLSGITDYIYVYNNVGISSLHPYQAILAGGYVTGYSGKFYFWNNTLIGRLQYAIPLRIDNSNTTGCPDCATRYGIGAVKNNIFVSVGIYGLDLFGSTPTADIIQGNLYYRTDGSTIISRIGNTNRAWTDHKALGYDNPNGVNANPNYNLANGYRLNAGSPAIDSGVDLSAYFSTDKDGNIRQSGTKWDIGAYEYTGTTPPPADTTAPITTASPAGGTYTSAQSVTLTANEAATIFYTTNGTTPTTGSTVYSTPIMISLTTTLKYFGRDTANNSETVKTQNYTINMPAVDSPPVGYFDSADSTSLIGWAYDPDASTQTTALHIYLDSPAPNGTMIDSFFTTEIRSDVNTRYGITGNHGFNIPISSINSSILKNGQQHTLYLYAINDNPTGDNPLLSGSPRTITVTGTDMTAPTVPTSLTATVISSSQINLSWATSTDNVGVAGYKIFRGGTQIATTQSTSYANTGLTANTTYSYTVSAYDAAENNSAQSGSKSVTTQSSSGQIILYQDNFDDYSADFILDTNNHACPANGKYSNTKGCYGNAVTPAIISPNYARVSTSNNRGFFQPIFDSWAAAGSNGNDSVGNEIGLGVIFPQTTKVLHIRWYQKDTYVNYGNFQKLFRISTGNQGSIGSQIVVPEWQRDATGNNVQMDLAIIGGNATFFPNYNLNSATNYTPGTWRCYEIKIDAVNKAGEFWVDGVSKGSASMSTLADNVNFNSMQIGGNHSYKTGQNGNYISYDDVVVANSYIGCSGTTTPPADTSAPTVPTNLVATVISSSQINLSWATSTDNVGVAGYKIFRGGTQIATTQSTSYANTGLTANTTYSYTVSAYDAAGNNSAQTASKSATTQATADTTPPLISSVMAGSLTANSTVISWVTNEVADTQVEYGTTISYGSQTNLSTALMTNHSQSLIGLIANTPYHYRVKSKDASSNQSVSGDYTFITSSVVDTTAPVISSLSLGSISNTSAFITWTTNETADTQVEYGLTSSYGSQTTLNTSMATSHSQSLSGLTANTTYHYRVKSRDAAGNLVQSEDRTFLTTADSQNNYDYTSLANLAQELVEQISRIEAETIYNNNKFVPLSKEGLKKYNAIIRTAGNTLTTKDKYAIAYFIHYGTKTTQRLGSGERAGVLNSYKEAYGKYPQSIAEWQDLIKTANGRWPGKQSKDAESWAMLMFRKIYLRSNRSGDNTELNAIKIMAYGLRPYTRNLNSEKASILTFIKIYRHYPISTREWDIIRAIANSGVSR